MTPPSDPLPARLDDLHDPARPFALPALALALAAALLALTLARLPAALRFEGHAFGDWGANLTAPGLLDRGLVPAVGFVYPYGLLPLLLGRAWFALAGATPRAYLAAMLLAHAATAAALARLILARRLGWPAVALVLALLPYVVPAVHSNLAYALETVLLAHALASHARGRRAQALALATAAAFCKPSMAYVYGLLLLASILARSGRRAWREVLPAALLGLGLVVTLALAFGVEPLLRTQVPLGAAENYRANDYGFFFGAGRNYWLPPGAGPGHYLGTQRGWWIAASLALLAGGASAFVRWIRDLRANSPDPLANELAWTLAALHLAFVALFFGNEFSWVYYSFILVLGAASLAGLGPLGRASAWALTALGLLSARGIPGEVRGLWRDLQTSPAASRLYTTAEASNAWRQARPLWAGKRAVVLSWSGHAAVVDPALAPDVRFFVMPGMDASPDALRLAAAVARAQVLVIPGDRSQSFLAYLTRDCPPLADALRGTTLIFDTPYVQVRSRQAP